MKTQLRFLLPLFLVASALMTACGASSDQPAQVVAPAAASAAEPDAASPTAPAPENEV